MRDAVLDCQMEQRAFVSETGQQLILLTIRMPGETRSPVMMIQAPLSVFLPIGIRYDIDGGETTTLEYQTCDAQGCYAAMAVPEELLQALRSGENLNFTIEDLERRSLTIPMSLRGFNDYYERIR